MALPETVPVKRTEEEADYVSVRPVVRQLFRIEQLVDMLLALTGKEISRLQQILRSGTVVYHYYRYWWEGFEAVTEDLQVLLAKFPDADPSQAFRAEQCTAAAIEQAETQAPAKKMEVEIPREAASRKRLLRARSLWECLMQLAHENIPAYKTYSYGRHADIYVWEILPDVRGRLEKAVERFAPRELRAPLRRILQSSGALRLRFFVPR